MTPTERAACYRDYAAECVLLAQRQDRTNDELTLIVMARAWFALAALVEKNETRFVVAEPPDLKRS